MVALLEEIECEECSELVIPEPDLPVACEAGKVELGGPKKTRHINKLDFVRLCLAVVMTGYLPVGWWTLFTVQMEIPLNQPRWMSVVEMSILVGLIPLLSWGVLKSPLRKRFTGISSVALYLGVLGCILWSSCSESFLPFGEFYVAAGIGSLWVYWLAWSWGLGHSWKVRFVTGLIALGAGWLVPQLLTVNGLTGDKQANFAWRRFPSLLSFVVPKTTTAEQRGGVPFPLPIAGPYDSPEFLGNRQGSLPGRRIPTDWEKSPPELVWKKSIGLGWGAFSLVGDLGVTMEQRDANECVVCYQLSTGTELWSHLEPTRYQSTPGNGGDGPRATPTIDGDRVYAIGGTGKLSVLSLSTGEKIWGVDLIADNGGKLIGHGMCASPLIVDKYVVAASTEKAGASLVAYDKLTGKKIWTAGKWEASYSSPILATLGGVRQILFHTKLGIESHAISDGALLWSFEWTNNEQTVCSQPIVIPGRTDQVLLTVGYGKGSVLLEVASDAKGQWEAKPLWTSLELKTKFSSSVVHDGFAYGLDDGILACVDLKTGQRKWKRGRYQQGQILLVGDWLIVQAESGELILVKPDPQRLKEVGRLSALSNKTWNHPACGREYLVVRNDQEAICYRIGTASIESKPPELSLAR